MIHRHHPGYWVIAAVVTVSTGIFLGIPHRLMWASPARKATAGIHDPRVGGMRNRPARRTRLAATVSCRDRRMAVSSHRASGRP